MAVLRIVHGGYLSSKSRSVPPKIRNRQKPPVRPPVYISTDPTEVNPIQLRDLYSSCNHSCHRFPNFLPNGKVEPLDVNKLRIALAHSSFVVSLFSKPELVSDSTSATGIGGDWLRRVMPVTPLNGRLVGFGRAVSDFGLTASIYDVMVIPSLQRKGFGRMIIKRIIRFALYQKQIGKNKIIGHSFWNGRSSKLLMLTNRGIYDVAAVCTDEERGFFKSCGFGDDLLKSTTMMYARSVSDPSSLKSNQTIKSAGRKLLIVPPLREPLQLKSMSET